MRICILSSFEDSMDKDTGPSVRIYNLAKGLAAAGNEVRVIIPANRSTKEFVDGISVFGLKGSYPKALLEVIATIVKVWRPTSLYFYDLFFAHRLCSLLRDADIVQFEQQSSGGILIPFVKRIMRKPVVVDCHDVFQALRVRHTSTLRKIIETFLEKFAYRTTDLVLTVSEKEKAFLISRTSKIRSIQVVPNGVDISAFSKPDKPSEIRRKYLIGDSKLVVFVGNLAYAPNREAIKLLSSIIAPRVRQKVSNSKFLIVGRKHERIETSEVFFTGFVENVSEVLGVSDVAVAPLLQGSGTRLKVLEYFSCSLPVVSTTIGVEGLDVKDGTNIFIEDNMENFADRIINLLEDKELSRLVGNNARSLAIAKYDWKSITRNLEQIFLRLINNGICN